MWKQHYEKLELVNGLQNLSKKIFFKNLIELSILVADYFYKMVTLDKFLTLPKMPCRRLNAKRLQYQHTHQIYIQLETCSI